MCIMELSNFKVFVIPIVLFAISGYTHAQSGYGGMGNSSLGRMFTSPGGFNLNQMAGIIQSGILNRIINDISTKAKATFMSEVTYSCRTDIEMLLKDLQAVEMNYAVQFLDAEAKIPVGILQGHWQWTGDYQQCVAIESPVNPVTGRTIKGKYNSIALFKDGKPMVQGFLPLLIGLCLPDSCDKTDVAALAKIGISPLSLASLNVSVEYVLNDDLPGYNRGAIAFFVISGVLTLLVLIGTVLDALPVNAAPKQSHIAKVSGVTDNQDDKKPPIETVTLQNMSNADVVKDGKRRHKPQQRHSNLVLFFTAFSIVSNTKQFLNTSTANGPLACLNGIRVISMCWVIQGHCYVFMAFVTDNQFNAQKTVTSRFTFHAIDNATFSIDTFFFLSGLLVAYMALKQWRDKGGINWIYYFAHRYWRLTPMYAFVLLFLTAVVKHTVTGPFQWVAMDPRGPIYDAWHLCEKEWWGNLLYINNLYPVLDHAKNSMCMTWSWYLANDMQFYVLISPVLVILLHKNKYIGWAVSVFLILACIGIRGFLVGYYEMRGFNGKIHNHIDETLGNHGPLYHRPFARYGPYVVGILTGHILLSTNCKVHLKRYVVVIGWCVAIAVALSVLYGLQAYNSPSDDTMSLTASGFYNSLSRTAWSLSIAWLTFACAAGYGGWVNSILSWKAWAPLGRLSYSAYLVHALIIVIYYLNAKQLFHFDDLFMVVTYVGLAGISYGFGFVVSMVVEVPMMQLEKLIYQRK